MLKRFDHVTFVVSDAAAAKEFFAVLGFEETHSEVISGPVMEAYMHVPGIEAEHVTLELAGASSHTEIQLLKYRHPEAVTDPRIRDPKKLGFNHLCFAVDDIEAEIARLKAGGIMPLTRVMEFLDRKLVFFPGPEGITLELSEWHPKRAALAPAG